MLRRSPSVRPFRANPAPTSRGGRLRQAVAAGSAYWRGEMLPRDTAVFLLSAATLAYQIVLLRAFSIGQWYHFAFMVISIALLGFGASGTLLAAWRCREEPPGRPAALACSPLEERLGAPTGRGHERRTKRLFSLSTLASAVAFPGCFWLSQKIPFDPFLMVWDPRQWFYLAEYYLVFFLPFFFAATAIGLALIERAERSPTTYFVNLVGSGVGAGLVIALLTGRSPGAAVFFIFVLAGIAAMASCAGLGKRWLVPAGIFLLVLGSFLFWQSPLPLRISQYKGLPVAQNLPEATIIEQRSSPLGQIDVLQSPAVRYAPGLSLASSARIPPQLALFVDADTAGAITRFEGNLDELEYLDWLTPALPYFLLAPDRPSMEGAVLILGAGAGSGILTALRHRARPIHAVELDPNLIALLRGRFAGWSGQLYNHADVQVHHAEARAFVESSPRFHRGEPDRFQLIELSLVDSFAAATAGISALGENYLYSVEAFRSYYRRLSPGGMLAVTRWIKMPPRDNIKLFATAAEALEGEGVAHPGAQLVQVRSWSTATLLVKRGAFTANELAALREFCQKRLFDISWAPDLHPEEVNRFNILEREFYFEAAKTILAGGREREEFFRYSTFFLRPATDDRPYFFHFFRWRALPVLLRTGGVQWLPFLEWGYVVLVATLVQATIFSLVLIVLPLVILRRPSLEQVPPAPGRIRRRVFGYFLSIGLGFLFLEMVLIQRLVFFLGNPTYAVSVVLAGILVFAGVGSLLTGRDSHTDGIPRAAIWIAGTCIVYAAGLRWALGLFMGMGIEGKVLISLAVIALPAIAMGRFFPSGLRRLQASEPRLLPWAWAVNGCASVVAAPWATMVSMSASLATTLLAAGLCYLVAMHARLR